MERQDWIDELTGCRDEGDSLKLTPVECGQLAELLKEESNAGES